MTLVVDGPLLVVVGVCSCGRAYAVASEVERDGEKPPASPCCPGVSLLVLEDTAAILDPEPVSALARS
jgi:hypothetical protein